MRSDIAAEILRVHRDSYGTGARDVEVHILTEAVMVILDIELTPAERTLMGANREDAVKETRETFLDAIAPTFKAIVEHATGRRVSSFLGAISLEPLYAVELFRFARHG